MQKDSELSGCKITAEFSTRRLRLRAWRDADFLPFAAMNADPRVMQFFPQTLNAEQSDAMATKIQQHIHQHGWGFWAIELPQVDDFIGFVGLDHLQHILPFSPCTEIGWRLAARHWGQGYASEAAAEVLRLAFQVLRLKEVVSFTSVLNLRSQAVMQRIGMQHRGEFFPHPGVPEESALRAHILYRISQSEWVKTSTSD